MNIPNQNNFFYKLTAPTQKQTKIISIEGNIGSGKSTLVAALQEKFSEAKNICFLQEPVDIWNTIKDKDGTTMLAKFYKDTQKYSFAFQMMAYISRLSLLKQALAKNYNIIVVERSMYTDKMVFAKMLYDDGNMEDVEYQIYNKWFDEFIKELPPIDIIYVKTTPEIAKGRVEKRAREGECIPQEYLQACHRYHENWINAPNTMYRNKIIIQGDTDIEQDPDMLNVWLERCGIFIEDIN
jgi:deoxyadenosine/deoxycytidine kinase